MKEIFKHVREGIVLAAVLATFGTIWRQNTCITGLQHDMTNMTRYLDKSDLALRSIDTHLDHISSKVDNVQDQLYKHMMGEKKMGKAVAPPADKDSRIATEH